MKCLLRELVLVRLERACAHLASPANPQHSRLLTAAIVEAERTLSRTRHTWTHHGGRLDDASVAGFMTAWSRLVAYEEALWGPADAEEELLPPLLEWTTSRRSDLARRRSP